MQGGNPYFGPNRRAAISEGTERGACVDLRHLLDVIQAARSDASGSTPA
jgi:hypothetical protein